MRTTLNIDTPLLEDLRRLQEKQRKPLGRLVSELIAEALANRRDRRPGTRPAFAWKSQSMRALIDLDDKDAVYAVLDGRQR